jgi:hypothetical protein
MLPEIHATRTLLGDRQIKVFFSFNLYILGFFKKVTNWVCLV